MISRKGQLVELVEEGIELQEQKEKAFFELAERFRAATDPEEIQRFGRPTWKDGLREVNAENRSMGNFPPAVRRHLIERLRDLNGSSNTR